MAKGDATGTAVPDITSADVKTLSPFQRLLRHMNNLAELEQTSGTNVQAQTVESILAAESEEEMFDADERGILGGRDIVGIEMEIVDFSVRYSNRDDVETPFIVDGKRMYLLVQAVRTSASSKLREIGVGQEFIWNTSAPLLVAKLFWLKNHDRIPSPPVVIHGTDLGGGQTVLKLKPVPTRAV